MSAVRAFQRVEAVIVKALSPRVQRLEDEREGRRAGRCQTGQVRRHL